MILKSGNRFSDQICANLRLSFRGAREARDPNDPVYVFLEQGYGFRTSPALTAGCAVLKVYTSPKIARNNTACAMKPTVKASVRATTMPRP